MQGRMTLLLGPPGSGKSTLLKALAGKLQPDGLRIEGSITYNGKHFKEFVPQRTAAYIEQTDEHIAELTCAAWSHHCPRNLAVQAAGLDVDVEEPRFLRQSPHCAVSRGGVL